MKKTITLFLLLFAFLRNSYSQASQVQVDELVDKGVALYDKGEYTAAIEQYKKALAINNKSPLANYEMASAYFALKEYEKAMEHADLLININMDYMNQAYLLKGTLLDVQGKPKDAIKIYKKGLKDFPEDYLLNYNLALTCYNQKEDKDAEEALKNGLRAKPGHASSHMLLVYLMNEQGQRVKALLAAYNFLLLEPTGKRAKAIMEILDAQLRKNVKKDGDGTTILVSGESTKDEFSSAELMLSMLEASKSLEENKNKSEQQLFAENTASFFSVLKEQKENNKGFWWDFYVDFYADLLKNKQVETLTYFISQSKSKPETLDWLKNNTAKTDALKSWYRGYTRKTN